MTDLNDPITVFRAAVSALNAEDWNVVATLADPVSLRTFHRELLDRFAPSSPDRIVTVEEHLRHSPDTPRVVAEYSVAEAHRHADPGPRLARELPSVASIDALRDLTPVEVFTRWLDGKSYRRQLERLVLEGRASPRVLELRKDQQPYGGYHYVAFGVVADGERIAHVLYRNDIDLQHPPTGESARWRVDRPADEQELALDLRRSYPYVATCRLQPDGTWRLVVERDFLHVSTTQLIGSGIRESAAVAAAAPDASETV